MAVGKRSTRPIYVKGQRFRWRCQFNEPLERFSVAMAEGRMTSPDRLLVRPEASPHLLLTVSWPPCRGPVVKPGLVRKCIVEALRCGWPEEQVSLELAGSDVPGMP